MMLKRITYLLSFLIIPSLSAQTLGLKIDATEAVPGDTISIPLKMSSEADQSFIQAVFEFGLAQNYPNPFIQKSPLKLVCKNLLMFHIGFSICRGN